MSVAGKAVDTTGCVCEECEGESVEAAAAAGSVEEQQR